MACARAVRAGLLEGANLREAKMIVRDVMTPSVVTLGPSHTLREAAQQMAQAHVGSAVVIDPDVGVGIISERAILMAIAECQNVDEQIVAHHLSRDAVYADPEWSLDLATDAMRKGGYRHLVVLDAGNVLGVISLRDIVRAWQPVIHD